MDGIFRVSQSPSAVPDAEPETTEAADPFVTLQQQNEALRAALDKQSKDSDSKITKLSEQLQFLNSSLQERVRSQQPVEVEEPKNTQEAADVWDTFWSNMANPEPEPPAAQKKQTKQSEAQSSKTEEKKNMDVSEFQKLADERDRKKMEQMAALQQKQKELLDKFNTDEKDLHGAASHVAKLWDQFAAANPHEDMEARYSRVMQTARELGLNQLTARSEDGAPFPSGGQGRAPNSAMIGMDPSQAGAMAELGKLRQVSTEEVYSGLENYARERNRNLMKKSGFMPTIPANASNGRR